MKSKYFFLIALQLFSLNLYSQSLQSELENQKRQSQVQAQMDKEAAEQRKRDREAILRLLTFQCPADSIVYYFFGDDVVYQGLNLGYYPFQWKNVSIDLQGKYAVNGGVVSWSSKGRNGSYDESFELHLDTLKFYRKILNTGNIESGKCILINDPREKKAKSFDNPLGK